MPIPAQLSIYLHFAVMRPGFSEPQLAGAGHASCFALMVQCPWLLNITFRHSLFMLHLIQIIVRPR